MPIYEYRCSNCGAIHELLHLIGTEPEEMNCMECGHLCTKIFSQIGLVRVHHTEKLDYNDPLRVYDRQRMVKDSAVKKALSEYKEEAHEKAKLGEGNFGGEPCQTVQKHKMRG